MCCLEHTLFFLVCTLKCKSLKSCDWYKSLVLRCGIDFLYILASSVSFSVKRSACWQRITWLATPKTLAVTPAYNKPSLLYVFLILLLAMFSENRFWYVKAFGWKSPMIRPPLYHFAIGFLILHFMYMFISASCNHVSWFGSWFVFIFVLYFFARSVNLETTLG